jgi:hypothetical protein
MSERNKYIQLALQNGIRDINVIANAYEDAGTVSHETDSPYQTNGLPEIKPYVAPSVSPGIQQVAESALGFVPVLGTVMDIENAVKDPTFDNITEAGVSVLADAIGAKAIKEGVKAVKWAKYKLKNKGLHRLLLKQSDIPKWGSLAGLAAIAADQGFNTTALRDALGQTYTDIYSGLNRD